MDNVIEYRITQAETKALRDSLRDEIDWWKELGWVVAEERGGFVLRMAGRPDKVVRNGVINHG